MFIITKSFLAAAFLCPFLVVSLGISHGS